MGKPTRSGIREGNDSTENLQQLERKLDELIPATDGSAFSSLCKVTIRPGETIALGGFETADGKYQITFIQPTAPDASGQIRISSKVVAMSHESVESIGMTGLLNAGRMRRQQTVVLDEKTYAENSNFLAGQIGSELLTSPEIIVHPDQVYKIGMGNGIYKYSLSGTVSELDETGHLIFRGRIETSGTP